jgi:3-hydroxybutyryl-CoA dehydrogenase
MFVKRGYLNKINTICICGAGTMGSGIAQVAAQSGFNVVQYDVNDEMLSKSRSAININLQKLTEKGKLSVEEKEATVGRIIFTDNPNECIGDVVIEAVIEDKEIKTKLFTELSMINSPETIFATNTSSISVSELSEGKSYAERFAGMHFFNPAPLMKLVEIIRAGRTSEHVIQLLVDLARRLGKTPVVCNDAPGFIVNRVARHYYLEAMRLVEEGLTDIKTIDAVMESAGFKMGPFKLMDLIGMDVNYSVSNIVWQTLGKPERLKPSFLQKIKVDAGELGRKTGKGFYNY